MRRSRILRFPAQHGFALFAATMLFCSGYNHVAAQSDSGSAPEAENNLDNWWLKSAASWDTVPAQWLFHVQANYSFNYQSGNIEGISHSGLAKLWLRKGLATLALQGSVSTQSLSVARGSAEVTSDEHQISPTLSYALSSTIVPELGFYWEQNSAAFIDQRRIGYVGVRFTPFSSQAVSFSVLPAYGYLHEQALLTGETQWFQAPYIEEDLSWQVNDRLTLHHEANALASSSDIETYRIRMTNTVEFPVTTFLSLTLNHEIRYNNNPIPTASAVSALTDGEGTVYKTDNDLTIGIRLQN